MNLFDLPSVSRVNRVIPKNTFDVYTNKKQKRLFVDQILRITWLYKISSDTINLPHNVIPEIQVFLVELKSKEEIKIIIDIIDKAIPYHIIFIVEYEKKVYITTSTKHSNPLNINSSVIDWTFKTEWFSPEENKYSLQLKNSIDAVYHNFCIQLSGYKDFFNSSINELIEYSQTIDTLKTEIKRLKSNLLNCKQFNKKVELNLKLIDVKDQLNKKLRQ